MKVPIGWLRQYVDLPRDAREIGDTLARLGFPVDGTQPPPTLSGIVVGKIVALDKHPNADRLQIGTIDIGLREPLRIATAATNVAAGQTIAVAQIGAQLPTLQIQKRTMRGFESEGMMISAEELGLNPEWFEDGILQLDQSALLGADVVQTFNLDDAVLDVEVTANRPDALSIIGIARELAAANGSELRLPREMLEEQPRVTSPGVDRHTDPQAPAVTIASDDCRRFVAQRFSATQTRTSPLWMRIRLALAGQRPISNLVDISNYVMLEVGQPLHFYDAAGLAGNRIIVRDARPGETLITLDDGRHELSPAALVIADENQAQGLAGLMGGKASEVRATTQSIILESANFRGARVRRMGTAFGIRTEASTRHEKTLPLILTDVGAARAAALLVGEGATAYAPQAYGEAIAPPRPIAFPIAEVPRLLGFELPAKTIQAHLRALGFGVTDAGKGILEVVPPAWRTDVGIPADIVEEVARMAGYDSVPAQIAAIADQRVPSRMYHVERKLARTLRTLGYCEIVSYSLVGSQIRERFSAAGIEPSARSVEVRNPLSEDQRYLRYALGPGFLNYFSGRDEPLKIFELGHVFTQGEHIEETSMLGFAFTAAPLDEPAWHDSHVLRLKGDAEAIVHAMTGRKPEVTADRRTGLHPGKTAVLMIDGKEVAYVGQADPRLAHAFNVPLPVYVGAMYPELLPDASPPQFTVPSRFPSTYRDVALVVGYEVTAKAIEGTIRASIGELCTGVRVFDEYRGSQVAAQRKSLAARITLQRFDTTITDAEAETAVKRALAALSAEVGATLRT